MQEITALKSAAFVGGSEATQHDLSNLVDILTACISALHEQRHTTLISEIFSIPLWEAIGVSQFMALKQEKPCHIGDGSKAMQATTVSGTDI